jgi:hypothetical protein
MLDQHLPHFAFPVMLYTSLVEPESRLLMWPVHNTKHILCICMKMDADGWDSRVQSEITREFRLQCGSFGGFSSNWYSTQKLSSCSKRMQEQVL